MKISKARLRQIIKEEIENNGWRFKEGNNLVKIVPKKTEDEMDLECFYVQVYQNNKQIALLKAQTYEEAVQKAEQELEMIRNSSFD